VTEQDVLVGFRLRLFTLAEELGNVSAACRATGVDRSTLFTARKAKVATAGAWRRCACANGGAPDAEPDRTASGATDHRVCARAPRLRAAAHQRRARAGEVGRPPDLRARRLAGAGALVRVRLNTHASRLALIARHRDPSLGSVCGSDPSRARVRSGLYRPLQCTP
jgi:hypothetical protein